MHWNKSVVLWIIAVSVILILTAGIASAATVTQSISYQGNLTNAAGTPLTGTFSVTFRLYNVASGGTALANDTHSVTAAKGQFTTTLNFPASLYNGQGLWLGIQRVPDAEKTPRTVFSPVPYALSLRPGAVVTGSDSGFDVLRIFKSNKGSGVNVSTTGNNSPAIFATTNGQNSPAMYARTSCPGCNAVVGETRANGPAAVAGIAYGYGSYGVYGESAHSHGVHGESALDAAVYGKGMQGGDFATNQPGTARSPLAGVNVSTIFDYNPGVKISTSGAGSNAIYAVSSHASTPAIYAISKGQNSAAVYGKTSCPGCNAVVGETIANGPAAIAGVTSGTGSPGVYASTGGGYSDGVSVWTAGPGSRGVNVTTKGGDSPGLNVETNAQGSKGVNIVTWGADSQGLRSVTTAAHSDAIVAHAYWSDSNGIEAYSNNKSAIYAFSDAQWVAFQPILSPVIDVRTEGARGIWISNSHPDVAYSIYTNGGIMASHYDTPTSDVAEYMPVNGNVTPGTVLIIGEEGKLEPCMAEYDTRVAGIVSTAPGLSLGEKESVRPGDGNPGEAQIAVAGRVPCKVDASYGAIHPGDVLTTSMTPGYAMKAVPLNIGGMEIYKPSTVLGKAMGTQESGTGTIEVLVTLQ